MDGDSKSIKLLLHGSGFDSLLKLVEPTDHLPTLLSDVVNYYDNESGRLVFGEEKFFLWLEDVLKITDLSLDQNQLSQEKLRRNSYMFCGIDWWVGDKN